jgi:hypothetical protein
MPEINKKIIYSFIILIVILAGVGLMYGKVKRGQNVLEEKNIVERQVLPNEQLPGEFPKDFPLESGAQIMQNQNVTVAGKTQGRRQFVSAKSLDENYQIYKNYMKQTGWEIISDVNEATLKSLIGRQGNQILTVSIGKNSTSGQVIVNAAVEY